MNRFVVRHIARFLIFLFVPIIISILVSLAKNTKSEAGTVRLPKFFAVLGSVISTACLVSAIFTSFNERSMKLTITFLVISLLGAFLIIAYFNCRISYDDNGFIVKNFFGIKRKYTYDQVVAIREDMHEVFFYTNKRRIMVDEMSIGGNDFIEFVKKKHRLLHDGKAIKKKQKKDIFNGNIRDSASLVFLYTLVSVITFGMLVWGIYSYFSSDDESNTISQKAVINSCQVQGDDLILNVDGDLIYKIRFIDDKVDIEKIKSVCISGIECDIYSERKLYDGEEYFYVRAIKTDDGYVFSFEDSERLEEKNGMSVLILILVIHIAWLLFVICSVIVGRNPTKFDKKIVRIFFKDENVKY